MTVEAHPVDTLLRGITGDPSPTISEILGARRRLSAAIAAEARRGRRGGFLASPWWRRTSAALSAAALVVAAVAVAGTLRPRPVTALGDLAQVAERIDQPVVGAGEYAFAGSTDDVLQIVAGVDVGLPDREAVAYVLEIVTDRWVAPDGTIHEERLVQSPRFFDADAERAYYGSDLPEADRLGTLVVGDFAPESTELGVRDWPLDSGDLLETMRIHVSSEGRELDDTAAIIELAADLLRPSNAPAELRSAVFEAMSLLDVEAAKLDSGGVVVTYETVDEFGIESEFTLEFDAAANLVRERKVWLEDAPMFGVPAGTVVLDSQSSPSRVVESLERP